MNIRTRVRLSASALFVLGLQLVAHVAAAQATARLVDLEQPESIAPTQHRAERDLVVSVASVAIAAGRVPRAEAASLDRHLAAAYDRMESEMPFLPSPRWGGNFDALLIAPPQASASTRAMIFLHGYGGNSALECWAVARAAVQVHVATLCPSIGDQGAWWTPRGQAVVERAMAYLHRHGAREITLAGLSNGARGAAELAGRVHVQRVLLVSGASRRTRARHPTLLIQGTRDGMSSRGLARRYAQRSPQRIRLVEMEGTHFLLLERLDEIRDLVASFLRPS